MGSKCEELLNKSKIPNHCRFPLANTQKGSILDFVPDENIGKNLERMCIRRGNLKYLDDEIVNTNLKKTDAQAFYRDGRNP